MFDEKRLRAQMVLKGMTVKQVAEQLGINESTLYRKMCNDGSFTRKEMLRLVEILEIEDPMAFFFAPELAETQV